MLEVRSFLFAKRKFKILSLAWCYFFPNPEKIEWTSLAEILLEVLMDSKFHKAAKLKLAKHSAETLAEHLLALAVICPEAYQVVEKLTNSAQERLAVFKRRLAEIKRRGEFYELSKFSQFANELNLLLELLRNDEIPAKGVLDAIVLFLEADSILMEMGDDSNGEVGDVFLKVAIPFFVTAATQVDDQAYLRKLFIRVHEENDYGVRDSMVEYANHFLTQESLLNLQQYYKQVAIESPKNFVAGCLSRELAAQLQDPELYEAELRAVSDGFYKRFIVELAQVYQAAGRYEELAGRLDEWAPLISSGSASEFEKIKLTTQAQLKE